MSFYQENIEILSLKYPLFKEEILKKYEPSEEFILTTGRSGYITAKIGGRYIHSNHNPVLEAERLVTKEMPEEMPACIVEGFGLGYFVEAILNLRNVSHLVILEPSPGYFLKALEGRDFRSILQSPNVSLLIGGNSESIRHILPGLPRGNIQIFRHRALYELNTEYYRETDKIIHHFVSRREVNKATLKKFGRLWVRNLFANLDILPEAMDVGTLSGIFGNFPVLLLAAGPSLDEIIPKLKQLAKRFIIVAVDTSAGILINNGITPDFIVVVDPQYWNTRHLDRVDFSGTLLMSESSTHPGIFRKNHKTLFFCGSLFPLGQLIEKYGGRKKRLGAGGSVATTAWDFCRMLSSGDLFCGGLDLGFPGNRTHFHGSFFEEKIHAETTRLTPPEDFSYRAFISGTPYLRINNTGTMTVTDNRLSIYIQWFEEQIKINNISNIWNISPLGVRIGGMNYREPETLLEYPLIRKDIEKIKTLIKLKPENEKTETRKSLMNGIIALKNELRSLSTLTGEGINLIQNYCTDTTGNSDLSDLLSRLNNIDKQIIGSGTNEITSFLLQPIIDEVSESSKPSTMEEGIKVSEDLYRNIKDSADFHIGLISIYLKKL